ncbi:coenzyme F420-0:L-glutamate ligase [Erysipelothrix inopinata]|uniref:Coenzyme F420-0:L-glutamate ligase n=1 Tax=Erysipelothrix inopinata TaxID=225084 RepID=A0A7G9RZD1_9FIRM|nr:coenzyme F420-0:L-glutamate ligase [Erysipelothrix inopinata]QNN60956.1 coenzyme F420-0:L-glutamate ligase [Erysipelothrix inopinata]
MTFKPNDDKNLEIVVNGESYQRLPIKTHVVMPNDNILTIIDQYVPEHLEDGDILFITEKIVAITQGRAYPIKDVKPRKLAYTLSKHVTKTPHGIGLGMPETMEMALRECGTPRILFAAGVSALGKIVGRKGDFYNVAGYKARSIDGPTNGTIPPYNEYVVLGPENPDEVAKEVKKYLNKNIEVVIVDINDLGGNILGASSKLVDLDLMVKILKDNPLGQKSQSTPMGIIRKVSQ